ncbi:hypothetical protein KUCAC02_034421 [Chaenocephalus aceratus]|nr:hypothetical protein KUCAC02_034421 [Chaenocephalus aceratus]
MSYAQQVSERTAATYTQLSYAQQVGERTAATYTQMSYAQQVSERTAATYSQLSYAQQVGERTAATYTQMSYAQQVGERTAATYTQLSYAQQVSERTAATYTQLSYAQQVSERTAATYTQLSYDQQVSERTAATYTQMSNAQQVIERTAATYTQLSYAQQVSERTAATYTQLSYAQQVSERTAATYTQLSYAQQVSERTAATYTQLSNAQQVSERTAATYTQLSYAQQVSERTAATYTQLSYAQQVSERTAATYTQLSYAQQVSERTAATYTQLSNAQQGGLNMCSAGWLAQARVGYPTTFPSPSCGFGHIGNRGLRGPEEPERDLDAFCYRMKEVVCECKPGYVGDGFSCTGNLMQVLQSTASFSNFLTQILNGSQLSESGKQFVKRLSNLAVQSTLFVPENSGLPDNQTLSQRDLEFHLSEGQALPLDHLRNGTRIRTRVGNLKVLGVSDLLNPSAMASRYINDRFVTDSDILASNGLIHVLQGPLRAPPPQHQMAVAHQAGWGWAWCCWWSWCWPGSSWGSTSTNTTPSRSTSTTSRTKGRRRRNRRWAVAASVTRVMKRLQNQQSPDQQRAATRTGRKWGTGFPTRGRVRGQDPLHHGLMISPGGAAMRSGAHQTQRGYRELPDVPMTLK